MSIIRYLNLDKKQIEKALKFIESAPALTEEESEEDCSMAGRHYSFQYYSSGLGDVISLSYMVDGRQVTCHLGYDDDGNMCN